MDLDGGGMLNQADKDSLVKLQGKRNAILLDREDTWRLKSRAIWLECGDENTKKKSCLCQGKEIY